MTINCVPCDVRDKWFRSHMWEKISRRGYIMEFILEFVSILYSLLSKLCVFFIDENCLKAYDIHVNNIYMIKKYNFCPFN